MSDVTQPRTIPIGILVSVTDSSSATRPSPLQTVAAHVAAVPRAAAMLLAGMGAAWLVLLVLLGGVAVWAATWSRIGLRAGAGFRRARRARQRRHGLPPCAGRDRAGRAGRYQTGFRAGSCAGSCTGSRGGSRAECCAAAGGRTATVTAGARADAGSSGHEHGAGNRSQSLPPRRRRPRRRPRRRKSARKLGTEINFVADPPEAFKRAKEQNKLVFMIHLSGHFEDKEFT